MGIPACLWRRTGEIYKGNKEFASLVNVPIENLREVWMCWRGGCNGRLKRACRGGYAYTS